MPDIDRLIDVREMVGAAGRYRDIDDRPGIEAVVATDPVDETDPVYVTVVGFDGGTYLFGPCYWAPNVINPREYAIPSKGDSAFVVISSDDEAWISQWWAHD